MTSKVLIVSPVRNEALHVERTARAMAAQTRPPDLWVVADDGSDDRTLDILLRLEREIPFMRVLSVPQRRQCSRDRLTAALEAIAFNWALSQVSTRGWTHIGKLDGDVELPPGYLAEVLAEMESDPRLGIAGGRLVEPFGRGWRKLRIPPYHVHGAVKLYSAECFSAIGGMQERLGWDTIDETYARMRGFRTRSLPHVVARHHRPSASAQGRLRGFARWGACAYVARYPGLWVSLRSLKVATMSPPGLAGLAFLYGYARAALRSAPRVEDEEFRRFVRRELRARMIRPLSLRGRPAAST